MSRYKAYPDYKVAESKWMDVLPMEWKRAPLKYLVAIRITDGPHETPEFVDEGVPFLSAEAVKENKLDFSKKRGFITRALHEIYSKKCLPKIDDVFMIKSGNTTGNIAIVETTEEFNIWSPLALIRSDKYKVLPRYVFYSMCADYFRTSVELSWSQGTQPNIGMGVIENLHIPVGSIKEQQTIVNFLDHETAKIDTLIAKQQELIKLLKEKRQAVISHAVTKGLNPNAPMRDSGVEWFSEIPSSWCVTKLKYLVEQIVDGAHFTPTYVEDGVPFLRVTDIQSAVIDKVNIKYIPLNEHKELIKRCRPGRGDLLLSKNGTIGIPKIVDWDWEFSIFVSLCLIRLGKKIDVEYAYFFFLTSQISEQISSLVKQSTVINLHLDKIANFEFTLPPLQQQREIVVYLKENLSNYDTQIDAAMHMNQLLQERRTALISAAVTGKIDVRDWQPPSEAAIAA